MRALFIAMIMMTGLLLGGPSYANGLKGGARHTYGLACDKPEQLVRFINIKKLYEATDELALRHLSQEFGPAACLITDIVFSTQDRLIEAETRVGKVNILIVHVHYYLRPDDTWVQWGKPCYIVPWTKKLPGIEI